MTSNEFLSLKEGDNVYFWPDGAGEGSSYLVQVLSLESETWAGDLISSTGKRYFSCKYLEAKPPNIIGGKCGKFFEYSGPHWLTKASTPADMVTDYHRYLEE